MITRNPVRPDEPSEQSEEPKPKKEAPKKGMSIKERKALMQQKIQSKAQGKN